MHVFFVQEDQDNITLYICISIQFFHWAALLVVLGAENSAPISLGLPH